MSRGFRSCVSAPMKLEIGIGSHWVPHGPQLIVVPAKSGSTSVARYFCPTQDHVTVREDAMEAYYYKTFVMRDPAERLLSAHRHLYHNIAYEELVDAILGARAESIDWPLRPQVEFMLGYEPTRTVDIGVIERENPAFPRINAYGGDQEPACIRYRSKELRVLYEEDWYRWGECMTNQL